MEYFALFVINLTHVSSYFNLHDTKKCSRSKSQILARPAEGSRPVALPTAAGAIIYPRRCPPAYRLVFRRQHRGCTRNSRETDTLRPGVPKMLLYSYHSILMKGL